MNRCRQTILLATTVILGIASVAYGKTQPIGQRQYIIDITNKFAPVEIELTSESLTNSEPSQKPEVKKVYLRDPNLKDIGKLAKPLGKKTDDASRKFTTKKKSDPKAIVFKALDVTGQRSGPRVQFTRETLSVGRSDEPLSSDFFDRVFEPVTDENF